MQEGSKKAILAAFLANSAIAVSKFVGFLLTGAASMLAESVHSVADSGNQALLLVGGKRASRAATPQHPFGYGRERYIYAFIVSIVLFSVGGLFALYEGYHKITHPEELTSPSIAIGVLVVAIGLETYSFRTAIVESNKVRGKESWARFIRHAKAPELPVVLLEDLGALVGLTLALIGVSLAVITQDGVWDGIGTIAIGILLVLIAIILAIETKSLLLGEAAGPESQQKIVDALESEPDVESVIHMRTLHIGPEELLVAAKLSIRPDLSASALVAAIDAAEDRVRAAVPIARMIYLEPDFRRVQQSPEPSATPLAAQDSAPRIGTP